MMFLPLIFPSTIPQAEASDLNVRVGSVSEGATKQ
jgi:hypothetical protein